jgi:3-oxoacyl-[acyl-carrier protein] reductase
MSQMLQDKVAIITGGGRGIGKAFALKFAEEGAKILIPYIHPEGAESVVAEIKSKGGEAVAMRADVSDEKSNLQIAEKVIQQFGKVDILVNNAGTWSGQDITPWDQWSVADWERIFSVNVIGIWLCTKAIVPLMKKQGKGKIINIASNIARVPASQFYLPYASSKGAVYTLTHSLAWALGSSGINVNAIAPGLVATESSLAQKNIDQTYQFAVAGQSIQRREQPSDLVGAAVFLASPASDFINGQVIYVDGGNVML